jgi:hypothetical protein
MGNLRDADELCIVFLCLTNAVKRSIIYSIVVMRGHDMRCGGLSGSELNFYISELGMVQSQSELINNSTAL